jgi:hypothetical protein
MRVEEVARKLHPEKENSRDPDGMLAIGELGRLDATIEPDDHARPARLVAASEKYPARLQRYEFDPRSEGDLALIVANAIAYLENPDEHTETYPR